MDTVTAQNGVALLRRKELDTVGVVIGVGRFVVGTFAPAFDAFGKTV